MQGPTRLLDIFVPLGMLVSVYAWNMRDKEWVERERALDANKNAGTVDPAQDQGVERDPFHVFEERKKNWAPTGKDDVHDRNVGEHAADEAKLTHSSPKVIKLASGRTLSLED